MAMKHLQIKYNLMHIFYFAAICSLGGFAAIFLSYKGLSNTQIGTVTGGACVLSIVISPLISSIASKFNKISLQHYLTGYMILAGLVYTLIAFGNLPLALLMAAYILIYSTSNSVVPLLTTICMNFMAEGEKLNFGLARGLGSLSYALAAVLLSQVADLISPLWMSVIFLGSAVLFMLSLFSTKKTYAAGSSNKKSNGSLLKLPFKYKSFFLILLGFAFMMGSATCLSTYLPNVIHDLKGTDSMFGYAVFFMAASELPVMAAAPKIMRKTGMMPLIGAAAVFYLLRNGLIALAGSLPVLFLGMMMQGFSYGLLTAVMTYYIQKNLEEKDQVMGQTFLAIMTTGIGSTIGNVVGGALCDTFGLAALKVFALASVSLGTFITISAVMISLKTARKKIPASLAAAKI